MMVPARVIARRHTACGVGALLSVGQEQKLIQATSHCRRLVKLKLVAVREARNSGAAERLRLGGMEHSQVESSTPYQGSFTENSIRGQYRDLSPLLSAANQLIHLICSLSSPHSRLSWPLPQYGILDIFSASVPTQSAPADSVSNLKFRRGNLDGLATYPRLEGIMPTLDGRLDTGTHLCT